VNKFVKTTYVDTYLLQQHFISVAAGLY